MNLMLRKKPRPASDLDLLINDIQALRRDVAVALRRQRGDRREDAWSTAAAYASRVGDAGSMLYRDAARTGVRTFRVLNRQLRAQPAVSVLVAFGVGLLVSRLAQSGRRRRTPFRADYS